MEVLIVGRRQSGKTTLIKALTGREGPKSIAEVPDERLIWLAAEYKSKKISRTHIDLVDSPIPRPKLDEENYIEKQIVPALKGMDALLYCIRAFDNPSLPGEVKPYSDIELLETYLILSDLHTVEKRLQKLTDRKLKHSDFEKIETRILKENILPLLESTSPLRGKINQEEYKLAIQIGLVSQTPAFAVLNTDDKQMWDDKDSIFKNHRIPYFEINSEIEAEINELTEEEQKNFIKELGIDERARDKLVKTLYENLSLITFLTAGEKESHAWTIKSGASAVEAAGKIHSDIAKGFIKAQVVSFENLKQAGSFQEAKKQNFVRLEGKDYIVCEGDIIDFRFNI